MEKIFIILGPTAIGKSEIAVEVAQNIDAEIISADSVQVFKGLNIGSGKITQKQMQGVRHHLIDIIAPNQNYSVQQYVEETKKCIQEISSRNKKIIIVGGTGLYLTALINNYDFNNINKNSELRNYYENLIKDKSLEYVYNILVEKNAERASKININDKKRIIRALEIESENSVKKTSNPLPYKFVVFALNKDRQQLYDQINARTEVMFNEGLIDEVKSLLNIGISKFAQCMNAIGYKEVVMYLENKITLEESKALVKQHARNYAKRQLTWIRGMKNVIWIDASDKTKAKIDILKRINNEKQN